MTTAAILIGCLLFPIEIGVSVSRPSTKEKPPLALNNGASEDEALEQDTKNEKSDDGQEDRESDDFLLALEDGYAQRKGELQLDDRFSYLTRKGTEREFEREKGKRRIRKKRTREDLFGHDMNLEYGITNQMQFEVEAPYVGLREKSFSEGVVDRSDWGDADVGGVYALVEERDDGPAIRPLARSERV